MQVLQHTINSMDLFDCIYYERMPYSLELVLPGSEITEILKMRFNVFNLELGEGLASSYQTGLDQDSFDRFCHHLVVRYQKNEVIGTYRMQFYEMSQLALGFYSNREFCLEQLPEDVLKKSVELGRACIAKKHRNLSVLYLLWRGIARYMNYFDKRYLFGCTSIGGKEPAIAFEAFEHIKEKNFLHENYLIDSREPFKVRGNILLEDKSHFKLPRLFSAYMHFGSKVISNPAIDRDFQTIDFLTFFDRDLLDQKSAAFFFN